MKQRRVERVERRRPVVQFNLISESKTGAPRRRRGCLSFLAVGLLALAALLAAGLGMR
ncbi:MAG TPA: hypothetical protein VND96_09390 [Candidatus Micrarchaeaceae archaeon]|nr:hypothetical protein [Candidatus Micrarchaeaceae archaeon]